MVRSTMVLVSALATGCVVVGDGGTWSPDSGSWTDSGWQPPASVDGELEVDWRVGGLGCEAAGITTVEVDLGGRVTAFPCADEAGVVQAPAGRYPLTLRGLDADGVARYDGHGGKVRLRATERTTAPSVVLYPIPARLDATWYFDNGRLCSANRITTVEASLLDRNDVLQATVTDACDVGRVSMAGVEPGDYVLLLLAREDSGEVTFSAGLELDVLAGDRLSLDVPLTAE